MASLLASRHGLRHPPGSTAAANPGGETEFSSQRHAFETLSNAALPAGWTIDRLAGIVGAHSLGHDCRFATSPTDAQEREREAVLAE